MFGIHFLQAGPTTYVMRYNRGQIVDFGLGLSFFYFGPGSTIVLINQAIQDLPFVFEQQTLDFQDVTIQGDLSYRVISPERLATQLDFSVDHRGCYRSDGPNHLRQRLERLIQSRTHAFTRDQSLREMLGASSLLAEHLRKEPGLLSEASSLGLQLESVMILSIRASQEMAAALQANARKRLLQQAELETDVLIDEPGETRE